MSKKLMSAEFSLHMDNTGPYYKSSDYLLDLSLSLVLHSQPK